MQVRALIAAMALLALATGLSGCSGQGDLGRKPRYAMLDDVAPYVGKKFAGLRDEPVSDFRMTDDESELRDRAYRFLMPAHPRQAFDRWLAELARTRVLPPDYGRIEKEGYFRAVIAVPHNSSKARYNRLQSDIEADTALIGDFFALARKVAATDGIRRRALAHIGDLKPEEMQNALARIEENRALINTICAALEERIAVYRYALQRLVIETPEQEAVPVEHALAALERCYRDLSGIRREQDIGIPPDGIVRKGYPPEAPPPADGVVRKGYFPEADRPPR